MICPECNTENDDNNKYCVNCGFDLNKNDDKKDLKITILSSIIPGGGYFYLGYCFQGVIIFLLNAFLILYHNSLWVYEDVSEIGIKTLPPDIVLLIIIILYTLQIIGSARRNIKYNKGELEITRDISTSKAVLLSIIICGSGLGYLELYKRFVFDIIICVILYMTRLYYFLWIWYAFVIIDTYFCANAKTMGKDVPKLLGLLEIK